jgi:photosystem II stability/assembly factor-like uncharacterized protein
VIRSPRLTLAGVNLLILALAVSLLVNAAPQTPIDPRLLDAPLSAPGEWFDSQRGIGASRTAYAEAIAQANVLGERTAEVAPEVAGLEWDLLGPVNIGGRINDVVVDPTRSLVVDNGESGGLVYAAAASGGVWRSGDAGTTFMRAWPDDITQAIGALEINSEGVLFAGTGEANPGGGSIVYGGMGMYRSTDAGATWENIGLETAGAFGRIAADPSNPDRIFAAASGNLFVPGGERGLYRSDDGGDTWNLVLAGDNDTTGAVDVSIDPVNPDNILAAMWDHYRTPEKRVYAGPGSGLYRSTDGGETWTRAVEITLPDDEESGFVGANETGRIGVAFSPADPSRAYAIIANTLDGTFGAMFRSDDGGATWERLPDDSSLVATQSSYGWWFGRIFPDPGDKNRLFVTGLELTSSTDGGQSFLNSSASLAGVVTGVHQAVNVHADQHGMAWDPHVPGRVYLGNDGGVYRSDANGNPGTWVNGVSQGFTQHYSVDVFEGDPNYIVTGLQDNMCQRSFTPDDGAASKSTWTKFGFCGDGLQTLIHPEDPTITYSCSQYGGCQKSIGGAPLLVGGMNKPQGRYGWFSPLEFDPNDPDVMYWGSNHVMRTTNGQTFTIISPDLSDPEEELEQEDPNPGYRLRGVVTAIGVSASDSNVIYAGTDNGRLWVTRDLGGEWIELSDNEALPGTWITRVTVDPADADTVYVSYSSYRDGSDAAHLVKTTDGGLTFTDITGDLPTAPVNDVVLAGDGLLAVATDVGVFMSDDDGASWLRVGDNLPTVPVLDLRYHEGSNTLTAATFGHGIQRVTLP